MDIHSIIESIQDKLNVKADVKFVFGNMVETKDKSIIPVSAIKYSFGGGMGKGPDLAKIKGVTKKEVGNDNKENRPEGKGVGGKLSNQPLGVFEITETKTRFLPVIPVKAMLVTLGIWIIVSLIKRKKK